MKKENALRFRRICSLLISAAMLFSIMATMPVNIFANETEGRVGLELIESDYRPDMRLPSTALPPSVMPLALDDEIVRVSIILESESTLEKGFSSENIAQNYSAMSYRAAIKAEQDVVIEKIKKAVFGGNIEVVRKLSLVSNLISANVRYGDIETIKSVAGVKDVVIETQYSPDVVEGDFASDPNMATSSAMTGSADVWASGYTGAGSKIAIIDTGIDYEHQSFDPDALLYSYDVNGYDTDMLMTPEDIDAVWNELTISYVPGSDYVYFNEKIPFGFNYIDVNTNITHLYDSQGEHGSHVAGIAAANSYIPDGNGGFEDAYTTVKVAGIAPDAQLFVMKVFGANGGAYASDYMAAIEDSIILGADAINLSLGSPSGFSRSDEFANVLDRVAQSGTVIAASQGNEGSWADHTNPGQLYKEDISFNIGGSPGSFSQSLAVASINNEGYNDEFITLNGINLLFYDSKLYNDNYTNEPLYTISGTQKYTLLDGIGSEEQIALLDEKGLIEGRIVVVKRGEISFSEKANNAASRGAIGIIIINSYPDSDPNNGGLFGMDLSDYEYTAPAVSMSQGSGQNFYYYYDKYEGYLPDGSHYYTGTLDISAVGAVTGERVMSDFSSWGIPASLELKPEITTPGGSINSVWGANAGDDAPTAGHDGYELMSGTSMAAPQAAGMSAVLGQYIRESGLAEKLGLSPRVISQSLLMSTATPVGDPYNGGYYYSVLKQGAGLANVFNAVRAKSLILMDENATASYADGKVKAELGDDPQKTGEYNYSFTMTNISGSDNEYTLSTDLFTQEIDGAYLSELTVPVSADITYTIDGVEYIPDAATVSADVDKDGDTDAYDAQAILDYLVGNRDGAELDLDEGDVDGDGNVTTYDAHLILAGLGTRVTVPAEETVSISVSIKLTDDLDEYVNGAYIEGYTKISSVGTEEGVLDVDYSIPIVAFYGNWTDPSMFEPVTFLDQVYETTDKEPYIGATVSLSGGEDYVSNGMLTYIDSNNGGQYIVVGNPYVMEDVYPADKAAIRSTDVIYDYNFSLIRNAADVVTYVADENDELVYGFSDTNYSAEYYVSGGYRYTSNKSTLGGSPDDFGFAEGDTLTVAITAIPEYYTEDAHGDPYALVDLIASGVLGDGASMSYSLKVDDTAPEISDVYKVVGGENDGSLTFTVTDNLDIAYIAVMRRSEAYIYADAVAVGDEYKFEISAEELEGAGQFILIFAGDYAGNTTYKLVPYGGESDDGAGKLFGADLDSGFWSEYDPAEVALDQSDWLNTTHLGVTAKAPLVGDPNAYIPVTAAAYIDGYVFFAGVYPDETTTALYVASQEEPDYAIRVADLSAQGLDSLIGLAAYEGNLIALNGYYYSSYDLYANEVYVIDTLTGIANYLGIVVNDYNVAFTSFAVDSEGVFYADLPINENATQGGLYTWTLEDLLDYGMIYADEAGIEREHANLISMAYDESSNTIYASGYYSLFGGWFSGSYMYAIDLDTMTMDFSNTQPDIPYEYTASDIPHTSALYMVPEVVGESDFAPSTEAVEVIVYEDAVTVISGSSKQLVADVAPWTLELTDAGGNPVGNRGIVWQSLDPTVATVSANGVVTGVNEGQTFVVAESAATPGVYAVIEVNVQKLPPIHVNGFVWGDYPIQVWADIDISNPRNYTPLNSNAVRSGDNYYSGTYGTSADGETGMLYALDGSNLVIHEIDPVTFEKTGVYGAIQYINTFPSDMAELPYPLNYMFAPGNMPAQYIAVSNQGSSLIFTSMDDVNRLYGVSGIDAALGSPMVGIAYDDLYYLDANLSSIGAIYYVICEDGTLAEIVFGVTGDYAGQILLGGTYDTGIVNPGASDMYAGMVADDVPTGSLYCDEETGALIYSVYNSAVNPDAAVIYYIAINDDGTVAVGSSNFEDGVWPVTALYKTSDISYASVAGGTNTKGVKNIDVSNMMVLAPQYIQNDETMRIPVRMPDVTFAEPEVPAEPETPDVSETPAETEPENENLLGDIVPTGSLNAVSADVNTVVGATDKSGIIDIENNTVKIGIVAKDSTNGLVTVTYDTSKLTFAGLTSLTKYSSYSVDEENGVILFDYASADELNGRVAEILFTYEERIERVLDTTVDLTTNEDGDNLNVGTTESILVRTASAEAGMNHVHRFIMYSDRLTHWMQCPSCGVRLIVEAHRFVNDVCTVCNYSDKVSTPDHSHGTGTDDVVNVQTPVEAHIQKSEDETV